MMLQKEDFKQMLSECQDVLKESEMVELLLHDIPAEQKEKAKKSFYVLLRIMRAKCFDEVEDIPLADIILCFEWQPVFERFFDGVKAGEYLKAFKCNFEKVRTMRKARVL